MRNAVASTAALGILFLAVDRLDRSWSETLNPACTSGLPLWRLLTYPLIPLVAGSLLAGSLFALISSERTKSARVIVGALVVITPAVPAYLSSVYQPAWWYPIAWVVTMIAGALGVEAVRGLLSLPIKNQGAT